MEPFENRHGVEEYKRRLGMKYVVVNANGKIWVFLDEAMEYDIIGDEDQMLTLKVHSCGMGIDVMISVIYAKCTQGERLNLWESMAHLATTVNIPWVIGGDFNVITNESEKLEGRKVTDAKVRDFNHYLNVCNLENWGFKGSKYTWWNGRTDEGCIFKRLDRILTNDKVHDVFPVLEVEHLVRNGSDHAPLSVTLKSNREEVIKLFRFLNFWLKEASFMEVVQNNWWADFEGDLFSLFHYKLKRVKRDLTQWSKETFGNIFQEIITLEEVIKVHETQFEISLTIANREKLHRAQADLLKQLNREEEFWKQKASMEWFKEGERNTKFFHAIVKGRRNRLRVNRIQNDEGEWLEQESDIAKAAEDFT
ncbi:uncharacterized protein [Solanum tuberosum]|uniref:uncharacterized protein n=1 Tax=Solanum tuberosum TaxID=4113 RepID=UPI00073A01D2|nr:PREDICTED: uncharacterized protein LOC107062071 [Solanum tuberosum]